MHMAANVVTGIVALLHIYFLVLEMFMWTKPLGLRTFKLTPEFAEASKTLAANQGLGVIRPDRPQPQPARCRAHPCATPRLRRRNV